MIRSIAVCVPILAGIVLPSSAAVTEIEAAARLAAAAFDSRELAIGHGRTCTLHAVAKEDTPDIDLQFLAMTDGVHGRASVDGAVWVAFDPMRMLVITAGGASDAVAFDMAPTLFFREAKNGKAAFGFGGKTGEDAEASHFAFDAPAIAAGRSLDAEASDETRLVYRDNEGRIELEEGAEGIRLRRWKGGQLDLDLAIGPLLAAPEPRPTAEVTAAAKRAGLLVDDSPVAILQAVKLMEQKWAVSPRQLAASAILEAVLDGNDLPPPPPSNAPLGRPRLHAELVRGLPASHFAVYSVVAFSLLGFL